WSARRQQAGGFLGGKTVRAFADEVDGSGHVHAVDFHTDEIAVAHATERTAGQRLRADVAEARAGAHAGKTRIGEQRNVFAERQHLERGGDLVGFLHAGAERPDAGEDQG